MEYTLCSNALSSSLIFENLKGEIIDYKLSSYIVNIKLIELYYFRPEIEVHCNKIYGELGNEKYIHIHEIKEPGIYHSKFILITTTEMLRLIIMTTNITEQLIQNCQNDYYFIDIPKSNKMYNTENVKILNKYLDSFGIQMKMPIIMYDWSLVKSFLLISIPNKISHSMCFQKIKEIQKNIFSKKYNKIIKHLKGKTTIMTTTGMLGYDIRPVFSTKEIIFKYVKNPIKMNWLLYDLEHNKDEKGKDKYKIEEIETKPFHFKRYIIEYKYRNDINKWLIITSANLTRQAWGTTKYTSLNAEFGIVWNTQKDFPLLNFEIEDSKKMDCI